MKASKNNFKINEKKNFLLPILAVYLTIPINKNKMATSKTQTVKVRISGKMHAFNAKKQIVQIDTDPIEFTIEAISYSDATNKILNMHKIGGRLIEMWLNGKQLFANDLNRGF